jgi:hypothetical protein
MDESELYLSILLDNVIKHSNFFIFPTYGQRINHYNINDKIYPWQNEPDSKTIGDMLDYRKLGYRYER